MHFVLLYLTTPLMFLSIRELLLHGSILEPIKRGRIDTYIKFKPVYSLKK